MRNPRNLEEAYVYATESNLATLEELLMKKSSSQSSIRRQRTICLNMLEVCGSTMVDTSKVNWGTQFQTVFPRTLELLMEAKQRPEGLYAALDAHIKKYRA